MVTLKALSITTALILQTTWAAAVTMSTPKANTVYGKEKLVIEVTGACVRNLHVKLDATDSANKTIPLVWAMCTRYGGYWAQVNISSLKDGNIRIRAFQVVNGQQQNVYLNVVKKVTEITAPTTPTIPTTPTSPNTTGIIFGINGHDGRQYYPMNQAEARFKLLDSKNIRSYRFDIDPRNYSVLDQLVVLAKKYNIMLRPMVYPMTKDIGYALAKRYGANIKIWEIANEQDFSKVGAQDRINAMVVMYNGMKQASDELKLDLKFTVNVMACNSDDKSASARCPGDKNGSMWFLDMAKASGLNFSYVSFHYYPFLGDKGYWMDMYLGQMRAFAKKYGVKIFYNELNCANVYKGNTDGGFPGDKGCYDSIKQMFDVLKTSYADIVAEINLYEMLNEPEMEGAEAHFGLMYNINNPKPTFNLLSEYASKK